jgi:hypothetical protein
LELQLQNVVLEIMLINSKGVFRSNPRPETDIGFVLIFTVCMREKKNDQTKFFFPGQTVGAPNGA